MTSLKEKRRRLKLSQAEIAHKIGCTRSHYANIENGYRRMTTNYYRKIKRVLWSNR